MIGLFYEGALLAAFLDQELFEDCRDRVFVNQGMSIEESEIADVTINDIEKKVCGVSVYAESDCHADLWGWFQNEAMYEDCLMVFETQAKASRMHITEMVS